MCDITTIREGDILAVNGNLLELSAGEITHRELPAVLIDELSAQFKTPLLKDLTAVKLGVHVVNDMEADWQLLFNLNSSVMNLRL